jgi:hypothetical protein
MRFGTGLTNGFIIHPAAGVPLIAHRADSKEFRVIQKVLTRGLKVEGS